MFIESKFLTVLKHSFSPHLSPVRIIRNRRILGTQVPIPPSPPLFLRSNDRRQAYLDRGNVALIAMFVLTAASGALSFLSVMFKL
jgi:hypothetical protein